MTRIIIDTNIYLNFYRLDSGQSLEMIKNLNKLIKSNKFKLILLKQIEDEFLRNKNSKSAIYGDHILNFEKGLEVQFKIPHLIKSTQKIEQIKKIVERLNILKKKAVEDYKNRVFNPNSKINQQIKILFSSADRPIETDPVLQKAWFRTLRGNPPRKDNSSFGDAIIWETILDQCSDDDLILISGDGDFESEINQGEIHELLNEEWSKKTNKKIKLYTKLGSFINENIKDKKKQIKEETIKEEEKLNSIFNIPNNLVFVQPTENNSPFLINQPAISPHTVVWGSHNNSIWSNKCSCCGAEMNKNPGSLSFISSLSSTYCENCKDAYIIPGKNCNMCGKHFHRNLLISRISLNSFYDNNGKCDECIKK